MTQHILDPRGTFPKIHSLTFGKDGKPFFISGPYDNVDVIMSKLERTAGTSNDDYLINVELL